jgi:hypothetical protein
MGGELRARGRVEIGEHGQTRGLWVGPKRRWLAATVTGGFPEAVGTDNENEAGDAWQDSAAPERAVGSPSGQDGHGAV